MVQAEPPVRDACRNRPRSRSCARDAANIESKEAGFTVLEPEAIPPAIGGILLLPLGFGGMVLPPQYKIPVNVTATASVI